MQLGGDLKPAWILVKGVLFGLVVILSASLLILAEGWHLELPLVLILIWSSARLYYFCFYVITNYVDPSFRYAGIASVLGWLIKNRANDKDRNAK